MNAADPACFPARGLPQSGSKGLSQSPLDSRRAANTPSGYAPAFEAGARNDYAQRPAASRSSPGPRRAACAASGWWWCTAAAALVREARGSAIAKAASVASWKPDSDQLLLARVGVDVADREDARRRGLEASRCRRRSACARAPGPTGRSARASGSSRRTPAARRAAASRARRRCRSTMRPCRRRRRLFDAASAGRRRTRSCRRRAQLVHAQRTRRRRGSKSSRRCTRVTLPAAAGLRRAVERRRHAPRRRRRR